MVSDLADLIFYFFSHEKKSKCISKLKTGQKVAFKAVHKWCECVFVMKFHFWITHCDIRSIVFRTQITNASTRLLETIWPLVCALNRFLMRFLLLLLLLVEAKVSNFHLCYTLGLGNESKSMSIITFFFAESIERSKYEIWWLGRAASSGRHSGK